MDYQDTVNWMFQQLPMYQNRGKIAYKKDLSNTILLSKYLNHPENTFKAVHIAGTNGKGSSSHMLASVLQEAGYKVGLYTSPHLKDFRERVKINGTEINRQFVIDFIKKHKSFFEDNALSFFEMTVGLAFDYFSKEKVDIAIIEVGLGGRLDSTNIITPEVSVITNIGLDHTQFLGNTIEGIAQEKAGIMKPNIPVVIGETQIETQTIFETMAIKNGSKIYFADQLVKEPYESDLKGDYQKNNIKTVLQTIKILSKRGYKLTAQQVISGLNNVVKNTGLKGRWQTLQQQPKIICDTAHNKEGLRYVMNQLKKETYHKLHIVFGVVDDKSLNPILEVLPKDAIYYFCRPNIQRGLDVYELKSIFDSHGFKGDVFLSVAKALEIAKQQASIRDLIFVGGSTFVVAEII